MIYLKYKNVICVVMQILRGSSRSICLLYFWPFLYYHLYSIFSLWFKIHVQDGVFMAATMYNLKELKYKGKNDLLSFMAIMMISGSLFPVRMPVCDRSGRMIP